MGPGHLGVAFAVKPLTPKAPLWLLLIASEALDLLCFGFIAIGMEKAAVSQTDFQCGVQTIETGSIPWSHGFFMSIVWSLIFTIIAYLVFKNWRTSRMVGLVVFSHWILDFIVHPPDLPLLFRDSPELGLGLWTSGPGLIFSAVLEFVLLGSGIAIYWISRRRKDAL